MIAEKLKVTVKVETRLSLKGGLKTRAKERDMYTLKRTDWNPLMAARTSTLCLTIGNGTDQAVHSPSLHACIALLACEGKFFRKRWKLGLVRRSLLSNM